MVSEEVMDRVLRPWIEGGSVEVRATRDEKYTENCPGRTDLSSRQGHYMFGSTYSECMRELQSRFPGEKLTFQVWGSHPRRGKVIVGIREVLVFQD